jgi:hypothetical protein
MTQVCKKSRPEEVRGYDKSRLERDFFVLRIGLGRDCEQYSFLGRVTCKSVCFLSHTSPARIVSRIVLGQI